MAEPSATAWDMVRHISITFLGPPFSFLLGVYISHRIGLYPKNEAKDLFLKCIPVGFLVIGAFMQGASASHPSIPNATIYGFSESIGTCLLSYGALMFVGTKSTDLFGSYRDKSGG